MNRIRRATRVYSLIFPALFALAFALQWQRTDGGRDTAILFVGAANSRIGQSIYHPLPEPGVFQQQPVYNYPPPVAAALGPLTHLGYPAFARVWLVILTAAFWVFAATTARIWTGAYELRPTLVAGALLWFMPGVVVVWNMANIDVIVWALVALAFAHTGATRGSALAAATIIKLTPVWTLVAALRSRRAALGALAAMAVASAVTLLAFGVGGSLEESSTFLTMLSSMSQGEFWRVDTQSWSIAGHAIPPLAPGNLSLSMAAVHALDATGLWTYEGGSLPPVLRGWMLVAGTGIPIAVAIGTRRWPVERSMGAVLLASLAFAPILRVGYLPMLVPAALAWRSRRKA